MQSLIHGNFEGAAQKKTYALVGAAAAIAAAVGPLLGGFLTTYLSWRVGFLLELIVIAIVLSQIRLVKDVPYTGDRHVDVVGAILSVLGMGGVVLGILVWQEGGDYVVLLIALGALALAAFARWLVRRHREGKVTVLDPDLFRLAQLPARDIRADAAERHPRRRDDRPADLPADQAGVQRDADRAVPGPALTDDVRGGDPRRTKTGSPALRERHPHRVRAQHRRHGAADPDRSQSDTRAGTWSSL